MPANPFPIIERYKKEIPFLGVCLGHQCIAFNCGGEIIQAPTIMHGKTSLIHHDNQTLFETLPSPLQVMRYHSLIVDKKTLPKEFIITAQTEDDIIMGIRHKEYPLEGIQFHPESIETPHGLDMLRQYLKTYGVLNSCY